MSRVVILAGGRGTRLKPYTVSLPKPLMPIGDSPILEIIIRQLVFAGFERATLAVNHQADILRAYFGDGSKLGLSIDYSLETQALSTMGPLRLISDLPENFLVMNGDILTDLDYRAFFEQHVENGDIFTVSAAGREQKIDYGVLDVGQDGKLTAFTEKPSIPYVVSMGIYCMSAAALKWIPVGRPYGFDNLVVDLLAERVPITVRRHSGYWLDIGRPDDYQQAVEDWPARSLVSAAW